MFRLTNQLGFNINRVALLFRRELIRALKEYDLSPEQWQVLASLWDRQILSQKDVAHITLQDAPSISRMIARMERNRFINVQPSSQDRRLKIISLSSKGAALKKTLPGLLKGHFDSLLKDFSKREQQQLLSL
ncbi:MAG: MarR family transcriptional regulator, partial [Leptospiraceae bacterium]|nr:MarR family transcriptional regulator [Leptospiraceae bacterium]